jgi:hypothetical protein
MDDLFWGAALGLILGSTIMFVLMDNRIHPATASIDRAQITLGGEAAFQTTLKYNVVYKNGKLDKVEFRSNVAQKVSQ